MYPTSINLDYLEEVVEILSRGGVIVYPTDSLYAIGCDALHNRAVERVCRLKGINPAKQRLSICCASISQASEYAQISNTSFRLMKVPRTDVTDSPLRTENVYRTINTIPILQATREGYGYILV